MPNITLTLADYTLVNKVVTPGQGKPTLAKVVAGQTPQEVIAFIGSDAGLKLQATDDGSNALRKAIKAALYALLYNKEFYFSANFTLFESAQITVAKSKEDPDTVKMMRVIGASQKIPLANIAEAFGVEQATQDKLKGGNVTITDFLINTKTKEYAVGVAIEDPSVILDAFGLEAVNKFVKVTYADVYFGKTIDETKVLPAPAA